MSSRWGPDGSRVVFWSWRNGNPEVYVVNADKTGLRQLTDNLAWDVFPAWSPDGNRVAFDSDRLGNFDIWALDLDE
jgi:Tol biopolymer transport system component